MKKLIISILTLLVLSLGANAQTAPTFTSTPVTSVQEDAAYSYTAVAEDIDVTDILTYSAVVIPAWLNFEPGTQVLSGDPTNAEVGDHDVTLRVNDGTYDVDQIFVVTVHNENDAPTFTSTPLTSVQEDAPYSYTAVAEDIDVGDVLTFSAEVIPAWLNFEPGTQVLSGDPTNAEVGDHNVTLRVNDGTVDVDQIFVVTVHNENDPPTFTSIPDTVAYEDLPYSSSVTADDLDGDVLTYIGTLIPDWLLFDEDTQVLSGTPDNDDVGYHSVILSVFDGTVTVDTAFTIRVANENDAPTFTSIPDTVAYEDLPYSSSVTADDLDGDVLTYIGTLIPDWLLFDEDTQVLSGTPDNDDVGYHSVILSVFDGTVTVDSTFTIRVANENDAPTFTSVPDTVAYEDVLYSSSIIAADIDIGDVLTYSASLPLPTWLLFDEDTQVLSGTPENDDVGYHNVTLSVFDGTVTVDTAFTIRVANENDAPTFTSVPDTVAYEDVLYSSSIIAADIDIGDVLTYSASLPLPTWLLFDEDTQVLSGTPENDDVGYHSVTLSVFDGTVTVDTAFTIRVANENDAPTFASIPITTGQQGTLYTYTAVAEDIDGDILIFSAPVLPIWLDFDTETHVLSGTPDNDHTGNQSVSLMINDGTVEVFQSFVIDVENINDPPTITSVPLTEARPGVAYSYTITAEDIDGDDLSYASLVLPGWLSFNASTHILSATPGDEDIGDQHVTIRVSDGSLYVDHIFVITVDYGNHAPTFTSDPATSVVVGNAYVYTITANDIDGDPLSYTAPMLPDWLTFYPETHVISGVPGSGDLGRHDVTLSVFDGTVTADQSFPIFVENVNSVPSFTSTPVTSVRAGELYVYTATAEDLDGDVLTFSAPTLPDWLSFDINTHTLHGTPGNDDAGDHNVVLRISDGEGEESQNFVISVEAVSGIGLDNFHSPDFMVVYPNPSDGLFFVELSSELESEVILAVLNPIGKVLLQEKFPPYILINQKYNLSGLPAGIYFISVYNDSFKSTRKLIIH